MKPIKNKDVFRERLKVALNKAGMSYAMLEKESGVSKSSIGTYATGTRTPTDASLFRIASALGVDPAWLGGYSVEMNGDSIQFKTIPPSILPKYNPAGEVRFPVLGEVAAGYNKYAYEDWDGEWVSVPVSKLRGRSKKEHFVLEVNGDSMSPDFVNGDRVLILAQNTVKNGHVAVVIYDDGFGTLKRVEYGNGWVSLIAINKDYPPIVISGPDLEKFKVLGIPRFIMHDWEE